MMQKKISIFILLMLFVSVNSCRSQNVDINEGNDSPGNGEKEQFDPRYYATDEFVMGADLSYVNQILDHGGTYRDSGAVENPYKIFQDHGSNVVRLRLWHNPQWVRDEVYNDADTPLYSGLPDIERAITEAREYGLQVNLDFHYSDIWADPGTQEVPEAWQDITDIEILKDSVYQYTRETLEYLDAKGLMPEMVQVGNEINCGMMVSNTGPNFPALDVCDGEWESQGAVINEGIRAVREVSASSDVQTKVILHVAQPENVEWWFSNMMTTGEVTDFDIIGFSYYSQWSSEPLESIANHVSAWRQSYGKEVMIMETAYPWSLGNADGYGNIFGENSLVDGYQATKEGQRMYMIDLVQAVIDGGGTGVFYWEPAWITSNMQDLWGTGSSWENNALFDFEGNVHTGIEFYTYPYEFE